MFSWWQFNPNRSRKELVNNVLDFTKKCACKMIQSSNPIMTQIYIVLGQELHMGSNFYFLCEPE